MTLQAASYMGTKAICPFCAVGCGLHAVERDGVLAFRGDPTNPVNHGALCARGAAATFEASSRERVLAPLRRAPRARAFTEIGWDEAIERVCRALVDARSRTWDSARHATDGIAFFGGATAMNEDVYLFVRLARHLGVLDLDHQGRSCHAATTAAMQASIGFPAGTHDWEDLSQAGWILVLGSNPSDAHPIAARYLQRARASGATLVVVDPRPSRTSEGADRHLAIRPGTDVALLCGLIAQVLGRGLADRDWLARHTDATRLIEASAELVGDIGRFGGFDEMSHAYDSQRWRYAGEATMAHEQSVWNALRRHFQRYSTAATAAITGLSEDDIVSLGAVFERDRRGAIVFSMGVTQQLSGVAAVRAAAILQALLGNLDGAGGGLYPMKGHANIQGATDVGGLFAHLPGYLPAPTTREPSLAAYAAHHGEAPAEHLRALLTVWLGDASGYSRLPRRDPRDNHSLVAALQHRSYNRVTVLLGQNPLHGTGHPRAVRHALARMQMLVSIDPFLNETTRFWEEATDCDTEVVVLPAAAFAEKPGSRTNACRRVQWQDACAAPRGRCLPDACIIDRLFHALQETLPELRDVRWPRAATAEALYRATLEELSQACWIYRGVEEILRGDGSWHWPGGHARLLASPLPNALGRVRLWSGPCDGAWHDRAIADGPLPEHYEPPASGHAHPLHPAHPRNPLLDGVTREASADLPLVLSTSMSGLDGGRCLPRARSISPSLEVFAPAALAARLGLRDGAPVCLDTRTSRVDATLRVLEGEDRGIVWAPSYWNARGIDEGTADVADPGDPDTLLDDVRLIPCSLSARR